MDSKREAKKAKDERVGNSFLTEMVSEIVSECYVKENVVKSEDGVVKLIHV
jgi:hypothetical protein